MQQKQASSSRARQTSKISEKERYWRQLDTEQLSSGLSNKEFCQPRGIQVGTLQWWRRRIVARDQQRGLQPGAKLSPAGQNPFIPISPLKLDQPATLLERGLEIVLPGGATIKVTDSTPMDLLSKVLNMLEAKC